MNQSFLQMFQKYLTVNVLCYDIASTWYKRMNKV